jgi:hypothetical protein
MKQRCAAAECIRADTSMVHGRAGRLWDETRARSFSGQDELLLSTQSISWSSNFTETRKSADSREENPRNNCSCWCNEVTFLEKASEISQGMIAIGGSGMWTENILALRQPVCTAFDINDCLNLQWFIVVLS